MTIRHLAYNFKHFIVTLKVSILTIFITLFIFSMLAIITLSYFSSSRTLLYTADQLMQYFSFSLHERFVKEMDAVVSDNILSAKLVESGVVNVNDNDEMMKYLYILTQQFTIAQAIHWSDENGNFVSAEYADNGGIISQIIDRQIMPTRVSIINRDKKGQVISLTSTSAPLYDSRSRPWYQAARQSKQTIWSSVYLFEPDYHLGITIATPVYTNKKTLRGVLGVDIRLDWIESYIKKQYISPNALIFVVTENGKLIASSSEKVKTSGTLRNIHTDSAPWVAKSFDIYKQNKKTKFTFTYNNRKYLATYNVIPHFYEHDWLIGVVIPENDFIGMLKKIRLIDMMLSFAVMIMGIFLVSKLVTQVINPIKLLIKETEKIKEFNLEGDGRVHSRIKEIISLSNAIYAMKNGLKAFRSYVPADLVKMLILKGEDARLGGEKKIITTFFSDISDFTEITNRTDANLLLEQMGEYFAVLTKIIVDEKGTIDKYIGDSIMAFWGAPLVVEKPCAHAARAALKCIEKVEELNAKWMAQGKFPLYTRIGLHTGEAIVGNVGSADRMNYTAIGGAVNVANRLEQLNKNYSTKILTSKVVYEELKDQFEFRPVDQVVLRGLKNKEYVYELLREKN